MIIVMHLQALTRVIYNKTYDENGRTNSKEVEDPPVPRSTRFNPQARIRVIVGPDTTDFRAASTQDLLTNSSVFPGFN